MEDGEGNRMAHTITLEVPEEVYDSLLTIAEEAGESPEEIAIQCLVAATQQRVPDPLEKHIGAFPSSVPGWGDRHDEYIGQSLYESMLNSDNESGT